MVGLLRFRGLLVGLLAQGRGCEKVSDGREDVVVVVPAVGCSARPVRGSGGACCGAVCDWVGDTCGWWCARSAVPFPASPDPWGVVVMLVVRVVWVPESMIVPLAVLLARVVRALA